jgi:hypothetical protein
MIWMRHIWSRARLARPSDLSTASSRAPRSNAEPLLSMAVTSKDLNAAPLSDPFRSPSAERVLFGALCSIKRDYRDFIKPDWPIESCKLEVGGVQAIWNELLAARIGGACAGAAAQERNRSRATGGDGAFVSSAGRCASEREDDAR